MKEHVHTGAATPALRRTNAERDVAIALMAGQGGGSRVGADV